MSSYSDNAGASDTEMSVQPSRKRPRQARSRAMVDLILETTWILLGEIGYDATNTNRIAERAGISIGSLYQYFRNKEEIIAAIQKQHHAEVMSVMASAFEAAQQDAELETAVARLVRASLEAHRVAPEVHRVLADVVPAAVNDGSRRRNQDSIDGQLQLWLESRRDQVTVPNAAMAALVIRNLVESVIHEAVIDRSQSDPVQKDIEEELIRTILVYLTVPADHVVSSSPR